MPTPELCEFREDKHANEREIATIMFVDVLLECKTIICYLLLSYLLFFLITSRYNRSMLSRWPRAVSIHSTNQQYERYQGQA